MSLNDKSWIHRSLWIFLLCQWSREQIWLWFITVYKDSLTKHISSMQYLQGQSNKTYLQYLQGQSHKTNLQYLQGQSQHTALSTKQLGAFYRDNRICQFWWRHGIQFVCCPPFFVGFAPCTEKTRQISLQAHAWPTHLVFLETLKW